MLLFTDLYRPTRTSGASLPQAPLVPACCAYSSAWGTWRRETVPACAQQLAVPSLPPKQPRSSSCEPHFSPAPRCCTEARWACTPLQSPGSLVLMESHQILCYSQHPSLHTHTPLQFHCTCFKTVQCEQRPNGNRLYQKLCSASVNVVYSRMGGIYSTNAALTGILKYFVDNHDI